VDISAKGLALLASEDKSEFTIFFLVKYLQKLFVVFFGHAASALMTVHL